MPSKKSKSNKSTGPETPVAPRNFMTGPTEAVKVAKGNPMTRNQSLPEFVPTQVSEVSTPKPGPTYDYVEGTNGKPSTVLVEGLVASKTGHVQQPEANHTVSPDPLGAARKNTLVEGSPTL